jgi:glycosyltransferase involved in cell wall biosynthesis
LVDGGDSVEWFTAAFPGAATEEVLDGVRIVRAGRQWTVHWEAYRRYRGQIRNRFDAVIDEVNTIPFFTPWWAGVPTFLLIFQLAREVWWYESPFPISALGYFAEPIYLRCYRHAPAFTISASTERDLRNLGFAGPITTLPIGIEPIQVAPGPKAPIPTILYVGRLSPSKRVEDIVHAFDRFRRVAGPAQLWLVGDGTPRYTDVLRNLVARLGLASSVRLWGRLPAEEKQRRMAEAHLLVMTSAREGWGLVVTEANACGTPAVVYDVGGLRDAVRHEETGLVVEASPENLSSGMLQLWNDPALYRRLAGEAARWSTTFNFDRTAALLREGIGRALIP